MTKPTLTKGQQEAADAFLEFLMTSEKIFAISGSAGVGKTFLMAHLANDVMAKYEKSCRMLDMKPEFDSAVFTATTNKAAEVLENALKAPVQTIHSYLSLKVKENYKTGKTSLERTSSWKIRRRLIVFIDECSMIDQALYKEIMEALENCKIVFVGDHAQMAPVNEPISVIYQNVRPENMVVLTEPVRNAGQPALVNLCAQLRETVETGIFRPIDEVPGVIDYLEDEDMEAALEHIFQDLDPSCRVLSYTNTRVQDFNDYIRQEVRKLPAHVQPGDRLVVAQAFTMGTVNLSVEREVEVLEVGEIEECDDFSYAIGESIPYRKLTLRVGQGGELSDIPMAVYPAQVAHWVKRLAKARSWGDYFDLKNHFIDLRDKAACTVYKAQGSTYDSVFVDLGNIGTSYSAEQVARMLFVGVSRAKSRVFLFGRLPGHYHNSGGKPLWTVENTSSLFSTNSSSESDKTSTESLSV